MNVGELTTLLIRKMRDEYVGDLEPPAISTFVGIGETAVEPIIEALRDESAAFRC